MANTGITNNITFLRLVIMVVSDMAVDTMGTSRFEALLLLHEEVTRRVKNYANYCDLNEVQTAELVTKARVMVDTMCAISM